MIKYESFMNRIDNLLVKINRISLKNDNDHKILVLFYLILL